MLARNHVPVAACCWALVGPVLGFTPLAVGLTLPLAALAGTFPDIDHPGSWIGRRLPGVSHITRILLGHRGGTHSLLALLGCFIGLTYLNANNNLPNMSVLFLSAVTASLLVGYLSHIVADALTKSGVPLLWPYRRTFRSPLPFTTGSAVEYIVTACFVIFTGWYTWANILSHLF